jgi:hypothetical protein
VCRRGGCVGWVSGRSGVWGDYRTGVFWVGVCGCELCGWVCGVR